MITITSLHSCTLLCPSVRRFWERKQKGFCPPGPGWQLLSVLKLHSVSPVCVVLCVCAEVREEEFCQIQTAFPISCCCVFWESNAMSLIHKLQWRWEGVRALCCNTMNEQERNLGDWQGDTWNILCGLTYLVVVKPYLSFNTRAGTRFCSAQTPWNAHAALVTDSQNTSGSHFVQMSRGTSHILHAHNPPPPVPHPWPKTFMFSL